MGPVHEILALIAYAQIPLINAHADVSSKAMGLHFGLSLNQHPYLRYASSEFSGGSVHKRRHDVAFAAH